MGVCLHLTMHCSSWVLNVHEVWVLSDRVCQRKHNGPLNRAGTRTFQSKRTPRTSAQLQTRGHVFWMCCCWGCCCVWSLKWVMRYTKCPRSVAVSRTQRHQQMKGKNMGFQWKIVRDDLTPLKTECIHGRRVQLNELSVQCCRPVDGLVSSLWTGRLGVLSKAWERRFPTRLHVCSAKR